MDIEVDEEVGVVSTTHELDREMTLMIDVDGDRLAGDHALLIEIQREVMSAAVTERTDAWTVPPPGGVCLQLSPGPRRVETTRARWADGRLVVDMWAPAGEPTVSIPTVLEAGDDQAVIELSRHLDAFAEALRSKHRRHRRPPSS